MVAVAERDPEWDLAPGVIRRRRRGARGLRVTPPGMAVSTFCGESVRAMD